MNLRTVGNRGIVPKSLQEGELWRSIETLIQSTYRVNSAGLYTRFTKPGMNPPSLNP